MDLLESGAERIQLSGLVHKLFQPCDLEIVAVESPVFIENLGKDAQDRGLVLVDGAFGVDVKQDGIGRGLGAAFHLREHHGIVELVGKVIHSGLACYNVIGKQVGEHFQKVRFTAAKEA